MRGASSQGVRGPLSRGCSRPHCTRRLRSTDGPSLRVDEHRRHHVQTNAPSSKMDSTHSTAVDTRTIVRRKRMRLQVAATLPRSRWLALARAVWVTVAILSLLLFAEVLAVTWS